MALSESYEKDTLKKASTLLNTAYASCEQLAAAKEKLQSLPTVEDKALFVKDVIIPDMDALRAPCDELEIITDSKDWPFPTYGKLLFGL